MLWVLILPEDAGVIRSALDLFLTVIQHSKGIHASLSWVYAYPCQTRLTGIVRHYTDHVHNRTAFCSSKLTFYIHRVTQADYHNLQEASDCRQVQLSMQYWVIETQTSMSSPVPEHPGELTLSIRKRRAKKINASRPYHVGHLMYKPLYLYCCSSFYHHSLQEVE